MNRILLSIIVSLSSILSMFSQSLNEIFEMIDKNNVSLRTYAALCKAAKLEAHTGIALDDPEVEFGYLWGKPGEIGNRTDFSVTQSFDIATLFGARRREARSKGELAELEYEQARSMIYFAAQQLIIELTYTNKALQELKERYETSKQLEDAYSKMLQQGEVGKMELSRVQLATASAQADYQRLQVEKESLLARLQALCGDQSTDTDVQYNNTEYPSSYMKGDKSLSVSKQEVNVAAQQVNTVRAESLPELKAGYMSELTVGEKFRGITVGISIPLWKNKNKIASAKAQQVLAQTSMEELAVQLTNRQRDLANKSVKLKALYESYRSSISQINPTSLMSKALIAGEISLVDYINDRASYYDLKDKLLEMERDYQTALSEYEFFK